MPRHSSHHLIALGIEIRPTRAGAEAGHEAPLVALGEGDLHRHADSDGARIGPDNIGEHPQPGLFLELDEPGRVGHLTGGLGREGTVDDGVGIDDAPARHRLEAQVGASAARAGILREVNPGSASGAALDLQTALRRCRPIRSGRIAGTRCWLPVPAHAAVLARMTAEPTLPPNPVHMATDASGTCRSPASPRSCTTASHTLLSPCT